LSTCHVQITVSTIHHSLQPLIVDKESLVK
jgi:hypothetical protein